MIFCGSGAALEVRNVSPPNPACPFVSLFSPGDGGRRWAVPARAAQENPGVLAPPLLAVPCLGSGFSGREGLCALAGALSARGAHLGVFIPSCEAVYLRGRAALRGLLLLGSGFVLSGCSGLSSSLGLLPHSRTGCLPTACQGGWVEWVSGGLAGCRRLKGSPQRLRPERKREKRET